LVYWQRTAIHIFSILIVMVKQFIIKSCYFSSIGLIPFFIIVGLYVYFDPFKVLHEYESFYDSNAEANVTLDKDYVSTTTFIKNNEALNYNSFIFGNSRSIFYQTADWKTHLTKDDACFHFDANGESIWALTKKVKFVDKSGNDIKNMLLILDLGTLISDKPKKNHLMMPSPALLDNANLVEFHKIFFKAFLSPKFFYAFMDYKISGQIKPYMKEQSLLDDRSMIYDNKTNEMRFEHFEQLIQDNKYYTPGRKSVFYDRDTTKQIYSDQCIKDSQKKLLESISLIVKKHDTKIRIIINPLYGQIKFGKMDIKYLYQTFGEENVFDFSGINKFTNSYQNYYEHSHYRPHVAREIMEIIYDIDKTKIYNKLYN
jgi:hypothetical protein